MQEDLKMVNTTRIIAYILVAVDAVVILIIIFLRNRIKLAVAIIKEASCALAKIPTLTFYPVVVVTTELII